ncbi:hypothetical protein LOK49_LG08G01567 [Camellia lanceoleosa]|uniref:Uncharacterized protein n=1 Tax=Camellia lanceoleosa TaxID=1840588 RepID=A0ACC0GP02_9ERIC|nr:hypothetical protein LOK49_LG08G01567 [Camellia lanceoleosa]
MTDVFGRVMLESLAHGCILAHSFEKACYFRHGAGSSMVLSTWFGFVILTYGGGQPSLILFIISNEVV